MSWDINAGDLDNELTQAEIIERLRLENYRLKKEKQQVMKLLKLFCKKACDADKILCEGGIYKDCLIYKSLAKIKGVKLYQGRKSRKV